MRRYLRDVLAEHVGTPVAEQAPQILHERLTEENEALLAAVLEVNVEVVLLDALAVRSKLLLDLLHQLALPRDLRRLNHHIEGHLAALIGENF